MGTAGHKGEASKATPKAGLGHWARMDIRNCAGAADEAARRTRCHVVAVGAKSGISREGNDVMRRAPPNG